MKKYTPEEKYNIVMEGRKSPRGISYTCAKYGISRDTFYQWEARIKEAALNSLEDKVPGPKPQEVRNVRALEKELQQAKQRIKELEKENACYQLREEWRDFRISQHASPQALKEWQELKKSVLRDLKKHGL